MLHEPILNVIKRERKEKRKKQEKENKRLRINVVEKVPSTMKKIVNSAIIELKSNQS